jgi:hypothetical protein
VGGAVNSCGKPKTVATGHKGRFAISLSALVGFFAAVGVPLIAIGEYIQPFSYIVLINSNTITSWTNYNPLGETWECVTCSQIRGLGFLAINGQLKANFGSGTFIEAHYDPDHGTIQVDSQTGFISVDRRVISWFEGNRFINKWQRP